MVLPLSDRELEGLRKRLDVSSQPRFDVDSYDLRSLLDEVHEHRRYRTTPTSAEIAAWMKTAHGGDFSKATWAELRGAVLRLAEENSRLAEHATRPAGAAWNSVANEQGLPL
jgi:hypothetical protein